MTTTTYMSATTTTAPMTTGNVARERGLLQQAPQAGAREQHLDDDGAAESRLPNAHPDRATAGRLAWRRVWRSSTRISPAPRAREVVANGAASASIERVA